MVKSYERFRKLIQSGWAVISNGYLLGFVSGKIYNGRLKSLCLPGLNCYSCPGSLGSCPIGALQAVLGSSLHRVSFYMLGFFLIVGTFLAAWSAAFSVPSD